MLPNRQTISKSSAKKLYGWEKERLNAVALVELAKNLKAAQAEADLAALLEKMDFHLKQDDIFK